MIYPLVRDLLFRLPAESSHEWTLRALQLLGALGPLLPAPPRQPVRCFGLEFPNPVGLAAGLDKNGDAIDGLGALGFGFVELGTVTPRPQPGNPRPRMFRSPQDGALINRMGFNNLGAEHLARRLARRRYRGIVGANIGKNRDTEGADAARDYCAALRTVYPVADYVTVNLSSPNTPGLRALQETHALSGLLRALQRERAALEHRAGGSPRRVPLLVKIAPDLVDADLDEIARVLAGEGADGVIATNTTLARDGLADAAFAAEAGGLSGAPLRSRAEHVLLRVVETLAGRLDVVAAGGLMTATDVVRRMDAGARLVQLYTGFIYSGPGLVRGSLRALAGGPLRS